MTHTNHRLGERKSLEADFVLFTKVENSLCAEHRRKLDIGFKQALKICAKYNPVLLSTELRNERSSLENISKSSSPEADIAPKARLRARWIKGCRDTAHNSIVNSKEDVLSIENPQKYCSVVFDSKESLIKALAEIKKADLGQSVIVSGIFEDVFEACKKIGAGPHTVNMSAGIWGRTDLLPGRKILELSTMCGHGYVSRHLVEHLINRVKEKVLTVEEAAVQMSKQCICNFYNPVRAAKLIRAYLNVPE